MANEPKLVVGELGIPVCVIHAECDILHINRSAVTALYVEVMSRPDKEIRSQGEAAAVLIYLAMNSVKDMV